MFLRNKSNIFFPLLYHIATKHTLFSVRDGERVRAFYDLLAD